MRNKDFEAVKGMKLVAELIRTVGRHACIACSQRADIGGVQSRLGRVRSRPYGMRWGDVRYVEYIKSQ
jgi:hypothetical protein